MPAMNILVSQRTDLLNHLLLGQLRIHRMESDMECSRRVFDHDIQRMTVVESGLGDQNNAAVLASVKAGNLAFVRIVGNNLVYDQPFDLLQTYLPTVI